MYVESGGHREPPMRGKPLRAGDRVTVSAYGRQQHIVQKRVRTGTVVATEEYGAPPLAFAAVVQWDAYRRPHRYAVVFLDKSER
jgi:hypothetical protein